MTLTSVIHVCYYSAVYYSNVGVGINDQSCWIGLYKSQDKPWNNVTYWLDGTNSTYRSWHPHEPNSREQCVLIDNGQFYDNDCSNTYRYICKGISANKSYFSLIVFASEWCKLRWISVSFERTLNLVLHGNRGSYNSPGANLCRPSKKWIRSTPTTSKVWLHRVVD